MKQNARNHDRNGPKKELKTGVRYRKSKEEKKKHHRNKTKREKN